MTPNTRKPTVEEVGDDDLCWYNESDHNPMWELRTGAYVRRLWMPYPYEMWLPYSAIPDPNNQQQSQGEPK